MRGLRQSLRTLAMGVAIAITSACGPPWAVIQQSGPPSALAGARQVTVAIDFSNLHVGGEPIDSYMAHQDGERQRAVDEVLQATADAFVAELIASIPVTVIPVDAPPQPGEVRVTARFVDLVMGKYAIIYRQDSRLTTNMEWSVGGQVTDHIQTTVFVAAEIARPSIVQRLRVAGSNTARLGASFFRREQTRQ